MEVEATVRGLRPILRKIHGGGAGRLGLDGDDVLSSSDAIRLFMLTSHVVAFNTYLSVPDVLCQNSS